MIFYLPTLGIKWWVLCNFMLDHVRFFFVWDFLQYSIHYEYLEEDIEWFQSWMWWHKFRLFALPIPEKIREGINSVSGFIDLQRLWKSNRGILAAPQKNIAIWANPLQLSASWFHWANARQAKLIFIIDIALIRAARVLGKLRAMQFPLFFRFQARWAYARLFKC